MIEDWVVPGSEAEDVTTMTFAGTAKDAAVRDVSELRVVVLSDAIPSRNGVGTYYDDLVEHLRDHVAQVELVTPSAPETAGGSGWAFPMPGDPTQKLFVPHVTQLWPAISRIDPHVIVAATPGLYGLLGLTMAARLRVRLCFAYHSEYAKMAGLYWKTWLGRVYQRVLEALDRLMFRSSAVVVAHNAALVEAVRETAAGDVRLVGTPLPKAFLDAPAPLGDELRTVAYVGRLAPEKEVASVLRAAREMPHLRFRIAGDGPQRAEVEAWAQELENLEYVGWMDRERVLEFLDASDVLVLPSRLETFGTAALEAMARQRLVLVSHQCGIVHWDELAEGLFRIEEDETVTAALRRMERMPPEERQRRAERARAAAAQINDITIEHWLEVIRQLAEPSSAAA
jgi:glycosyltransferase involved in cell wall biosynthesis